jgi:hypothetical protein
MPRRPLVVSEVAAMGWKIMTKNAREVAKKESFMIDLLFCSFVG